MPLLSFFQRQPDLRRQAAAIYSQLVAQARHPWFYTEAGVPDTLDGRFEMIVLHLHALQRRLKNLPELKPLAQIILEIAFDDLDRSLRELGVGDMGIARRIRKMADGIYGRFEAYDAALDDDTAFSSALKRNVYGTTEAGEEQIELLLEYYRRMQQALQQPDWVWPALP